MEGERIRQQAREAIDQEINKAREGLRAQVAELAVLGAEKSYKKRSIRNSCQYVKPIGNQVISSNRTVRDMMADLST